MPVVYKAEATKLERAVALKFLAQHLLNDEEAKERFLGEAKAAAAPHHSKACPVYEIDEVDGKTFLAMAFLQGETLEDRIAKGPLTIKEAQEVAAPALQPVVAVLPAVAVERLSTLLTPSFEQIRSQPTGRTTMRGSWAMKTSR